MQHNLEIFQGQGQRNITRSPTKLTHWCGVSIKLDIGALGLNLKGCAAKTAYALIYSNEWVNKRIEHATIVDLLPRGILLKAPQVNKSKNLQFGELLKRKYRIGSTGHRIEPLSM